MLAKAFEFGHTSTKLMHYVAVDTVDAGNAVNVGTAHLPNDVVA